MEGRVREKLEVLTANITVNSECKIEDRNYEDTESEKFDRNGEERESGEPE
jgi:hypothetical protein